MNTVIVVSVFSIFMLGLFHAVGLLTDATDWIINKALKKPAGLSKYDVRLNNLVRKYYDAGYIDGFEKSGRRTDVKEWPNSPDTKESSHEN